MWPNISMPSISIDKKPSAAKVLVGLLTASFGVYTLSRLMPPDPGLCDDKDEFIREHSRQMIIRGKKMNLFYSHHQKGAEAKLMVFIHGLGGQVSNFKHSFMTVL